MVFAPKINPEVSEADLRPAAAYQTWRNLLEQEACQLAREQGKTFTVIKCPVCRLPGKAEFKIFDFNYDRCAVCHSLYVSPRPSQAQLDKFYEQSKAVKYWLEQVIIPTKKQRDQHAVEPTANWIAQKIKSRFSTLPVMALEYAPKFLSLLTRLPASVIKTIFVIHELSIPDLAEDPRVTLRPDWAAAESAEVEVIVAANVLDRQADPVEFIKDAAAKLKTGGLLFLTANTASGFEYQVLGAQAQRLVPLDRLNLLSLEAAETIVSAAGLTLLEVSTPGKLDVDIVYQEFKRHPDLALPNFLRYIFTQRDFGVLWSLQDFLQLNNLSSFLRLVAFKP